MKIGIMGGTFDPIHMGHLVAAESARVGGGLDEVWFMPSSVPPHKSHQPRATALQRWEMVCRAVEGNPHFRATDIEIQKGGMSYSIDTVALLQERHPSAQFVYLIGADMVQYLPKWHRIEELAQRICFIGLARPGYPVSLEELPAYLHDRIASVPMPLLDLSSTAIREERRLGGSIRYRVPEAVFHYIEGNQLYES